MSKKEAVQDLLSLLAEETLTVETKQSDRLKVTITVASKRNILFRLQVVRLSFYLWGIRSGKTTAQNFFLNPAKDDTPKPTVALSTRTVVAVVIIVCKRISPIFGS